MRIKINNFNSLKLLKKKCIKCDEIKLINKFVKDKRYEYGIRHYCKECANNDRKKKPKVEPPQSKICTKCNTLRVIDDFRKSSYSIDGYNGICKQCMDNIYSYECTICGQVFTTHHTNTTCCCACFGKTQRREGNNNWNPNLTNEFRSISKIRSIEGYSNWRISIYDKDNYTCQCCGSSDGGNLNAHHLDGYDWCEHRRIDTTNGITLCEKCHKRYHKTHGRKNNTEEQFNLWLEKQKSSQNSTHVNTEVI